MDYHQYLIYHLMGANTGNVLNVWRLLIKLFIRVLQLVKTREKNEIKSTALNQIKQRETTAPFLYQLRAQRLT